MVSEEYRQKKRREYMKKNKEKQVEAGLIGVYPSHTGGCTTTHNGYVYEFYPSHPKANTWGYIAQHRLIAELSIIVRPLRQGEVVHHIDEVRTNNSIENLQVMTQREHRSHHAKLLSQRMEIPIDRDLLIKLLGKHRAVKPVAAKLGVNHQTLRNRFPDLCDPFQRSSPVQIDENPFLEEIQTAAQDRSISLKMLSEKLRVSSSTITRICDRNDIQWLEKDRTGYKQKYPNKRKQGMDPEVIKRYQRDVELVRIAAANPLVSINETAMQIGTSTASIQRICRRNKIVWQRKREKSDLDLIQRRKSKPNQIHDLPAVYE